MAVDKISVLLPTYNRANLITLAIKSILLQTHKNLELFIYDDGSTDNTEEVVKQFKDKRINYFKSPKNRGVAYARNYMVSKCAAKLACWQDSDDASNINRLEMQYKVLKTGGWHMTAARFDNFTKKIGPRWKNKPKNGGRIAHASVMFKVDDFLQIDLRKSFGGSDADWLRRMRKEYPKGFNALPQILYHVRRHRNRIGVWKRSEKANPKWYNRMKNYAKPKN